MNHDRFDDALARTLTDTASTAEPCPDPAALAAFTEQELSSSEHATVEAHVASCLRCQAHLAALARATDVEATTSTTPRTWSWWLDWRWVTPVAATAVVVLSVWVIDPAQLRPDLTTAEREVELRDESMERSLPPSLPLRAEPAVVPAPPVVPAPSAAPSSPAESANAAPAAATSARQDVTIPPAQAARQRAELSPELDAVAPALEEALGAVAPERRAALADVGEPEDLLIVSAATGTMWRVVATRVDRSTDGGATWTPQQLPTASVLLGGSSPTERVCWIVGVDGTIVRTGDAGETWTPVAPPRPGTYIAVDARNVDSATVTRDDGAQFTTVDGGATWTTVN